MPYISTEEVKAKRQQLKKEFPGFKFSVRKRHHSEISVTIIEAPIDMVSEENKERGYESVNPYYIGRDYEDRPEVEKVIQKIQSIVSAGQRELVYDSDYGSVPTFYTSISIGDWDKPFKFTGQEVAA